MRKVKLRRNSLMKFEKLYSFLLFGIFILLFCKSALATLMMAPDCPDRFLGMVTEVKEPNQPIHSLSKKTVLFKTLKRFSGNQNEAPAVKVLKFGSLSLEKGKIYDVQLRNKRICKINEVFSQG